MNGLKKPRNSINNNMQNLIRFIWLLTQAVVYGFLLLVILLFIVKAALYLVRLL